MSKKILVIDDDKAILALLKSYLETKGFQIDTALDGIEGLEQIKRKTPDLIILDVMMPRMDGYTFLREIRKEVRFKSLPVVVLTAREMMREPFVQEGIKDYIVKPIQPEELLEKIAKYL
jgi:DNA-binding response OmpR family regulator